MQPQTNTDNNLVMNPVTTTQVTTVVTKKKKRWGLHPIRNTTGCIISLLSIAVVIFLLLSLLFLGLWIRTWAVFTQERTIAYITVSPLQKDATCKNYYSITFDGQDLEAAFNRVFPFGNKDIKTEKFTVDKVYGDTFMVYASFFQWKNILTFLGTEPLYKVSSIRSDFYRSDDANTYKNCRIAIPVNGGEDEFWKSIIEGKSIFNFAANATEIQGVGKIVSPDKPQKFAVIITHEGLILKDVAL